MRVLGEKAGAAGSVSDVQPDRNVQQRDNEVQLQRRVRLGPEVLYGRRLRREMRRASGAARTRWVQLARAFTHCRALSDFNTRYWRPRSFVDIHVFWRSFVGAGGYSEDCHAAYAHVHRPPCTFTDFHAASRTVAQLHARSRTVPQLHARSRTVNSNSQPRNVNGQLVSWTCVALRPFSGDDSRPSWMQRYRAAPPANLVFCVFYFLVLSAEEGCPALDPMPLCGLMPHDCNGCPPGQRCCLDDTCLMTCVPAIPTLPPGECAVGRIPGLPSKLI